MKLPGGDGYVIHLYAILIILVKCGSGITIPVRTTITVEYRTQAITSTKSWYKKFHRSSDFSRSYSDYNLAISTEISGEGYGVSASAAFSYSDQKINEAESQTELETSTEGGQEIFYQEGKDQLWRVITTTTSIGHHDFSSESKAYVATPIEYQTYDMRKDMSVKYMNDYILHQNTVTNPYPNPAITFSFDLVDAQKCRVNCGHFDSGIVNAYGCPDTSTSHNGAGDCDLDLSWTSSKAPRDEEKWAVLRRNEPVTYRFRHIVDNRFYIENRWGCDQNHPTCNYGLSWYKKDNGKGLLNIEKDETVVWKLYPVTGKMYNGKNVYTVRNDWGCPGSPSSDSLCDAALCYDNNGHHHAKQATIENAEVVEWKINVPDNFEHLFHQ